MISCLLALPLSAVTAQQNAAPADSQRSAEPGRQITEIIVTARKREESILKVPVIETALTREQLEQFQAADLSDIATRVPGLSLGVSVLTIGTQVSLRGVGTSTLDAGVDQSVSLNLDGLPLTQGLAYSSGMFDLAQAEVLKGPQALFYGKNSRGGVIALRTADPSNSFEMLGRGSYEFEARQSRGEFVLSGPVSDTLGVRLAAMMSDSDGLFRNRAGDGPAGGQAPSYGERFATRRAQIARGTVVWRPSESFDGRLKLNYASDRSEGGVSGQLVSCPDGLTAPGGVPFFGVGEDCRLDANLWVVDLDPAVFPGIRNNGTPFLDLTQRFGTWEMNYRPRPGITVTSTSGYYKASSDGMINGTQTGFAGTPLVSDNDFHREDFTQELRVSSEFDRPFNYTAGAFYQDGELYNSITLLGNTLLRLPPIIRAGSHALDIESISAFGQLRWRVVPDIEIAGGARWTEETRSDEAHDNVTGQSVLVAVPEIRSDNWSPELTVTYMPTDDLTWFASLRQGYKSGSFTVTTPVAPGADNSFGDEKVRGGELGMKSRLLDRSLLLNVATYFYDYTGLQTGANAPAENGLPVIKTVNAGSAEVYGVDVDATFDPRAIEGLGLRAAFNWNHARFTELNNVPCWGGQTIAEGCNQFLNRQTGRFTSQSLSGGNLVRAPDWQANVGADYETAIGGAMRLSFGVETQYSSRYLTNLGDRADFFQDDFIKWNANVSLRSADERWEVSLIGLNLGNELTTGNCINLNYANGQILGGVITGATIRGPAGIDELMCFVDSGREVLLRLTVRMGR